MKRIPFTCLLIALSTATPCPAEFRVNIRASNDQSNPGVAADAYGNFIIVWASYFQGERSNDIFARRFDPNGNPIGSEFQINTAATGNQTEPSIAMDAQGNFIVTWQGPGVTTYDEEDIYARKFDPTGQPLTNEFLVNAHTPGRQLSPNVAMNPTGNFVILWETTSTPENPNKKSVCARLFDSTGSPTGPELTIDASPYNCRYPDVAMDDTGNFVAVWLQDRTTKSIMARLYNTHGKALTNPFEVSTTKFSSLTRPSVAMSGTGRFVVTWDGDPKLASLDDIHARFYDPNSSPLTAQFTVNTTLAGAQQYPQVAMDRSGDFVIAWQNDSDISATDIFAQGFNSLGQPRGDELQLNTYTQDDQKYPVVALAETGYFLAAWQSNGQDGSGYGIFAELVPPTPSPDLHTDGLVNFLDFAVLANEWLKEQNPLRADLIDDNRIDERDLAAFCQQWLVFTSE